MVFTPNLDIGKMYLNVLKSEVKFLAPVGLKSVA